MTYCSLIPRPLNVLFLITSSIGQWRPGNQARQTVNQDAGSRFKFSLHSTKLCSYVALNSKSVLAMMNLQRGSVNILGVWFRLSITTEVGKVWDQARPR